MDPWTFDDETAMNLRYHRPALGLILVSLAFVVGCSSSERGAADVGAAGESAATAR